MGNKVAWGGEGGGRQGGSELSFFFLFSHLFRSSWLTLATSCQGPDRVGVGGWAHGRAGDGPRAGARDVGIRSVPLFCACPACFCLSRAVENEAKRKTKRGRKLGKGDDGPRRATRRKERACPTCKQRKVRLAATRPAQEGAKARQSLFPPPPPSPQSGGEASREGATAVFAPRGEGTRRHALSLRGRAFHAVAQRPPSPSPDRQLLPCSVQQRPCAFEGGPRDIVWVCDAGESSYGGRRADAHLSVHTSTQAGTGRGTCRSTRSAVRRSADSWRAARSLRITAWWLRDRGPASQGRLCQKYLYVYIYKYILCTVRDEGIQRAVLTNGSHPRGQNQGRVQRGLRRAVACRALPSGRTIRCIRT